jgi:hypothetical protein
MASLLLLGVAGLLAGGVIGAAKTGAPRRTKVLLVVLMVVALVLAVLTFDGNN